MLQKWRIVRAFYFIIPVCIYLTIAKQIPSINKMNTITASDELPELNTSRRSLLPCIYICDKNSGNGMGEMRSIFGSILPEYMFVELNNPTWNEPSSNSYDMFIAKEGKICDNKKVDLWLFYKFKGRIIVHSPESPRIFPSQSKDGIHYFGPILDERPGKDLILTYLQTTWHWKFQKEFPTTFMTNPALRPRSDMTHFMIYSNSNCVHFREEIAGRLSQIGDLHYGGKCKGIAEDRTNLTQVNTKTTIQNWSENTIINKQYRFCLVMEHEKDHDSYITEKILMAFVAGCIPVYWGPELIFDLFNSKSFIFYNISNPQPSLDQVRELESDVEKYNAMLAEPIAANGDKTIEKYFSFDDNVGGGALKKKIRKMLGV